MADTHMQGRMREETERQGGKIDPKYELSPEVNEMYDRVTYDREPTQAERDSVAAEIEAADLADD